MRAAGFVGAVVLTLSGVVSFAQTKPSFAGHWVFLPDPAASSGAGRGEYRAGALGQSATVVQDDKQLSVTTTNQNGRGGRDSVGLVNVTRRYNLDGTDSKNTMAFDGGSVDQLSHVSWKGEQLVIITSIRFNGRITEVTQTWSLDNEGNLVIEQSGNGTSFTTKYKKS
jgi:hypothetical protein